MEQSLISTNTDERKHTTIRSQALTIATNMQQHVDWILLHDGNSLNKQIADINFDNSISAKLIMFSSKMKQLSNICTLRNEI
jgi:dsDNA-specific endonuclease/ATPase MutS2